MVIKNTSKSGRFDDDRAWFSRSSKSLTLGITNSCIEWLGELESVELPDDGEDFIKDDIVVTIEGSNGTYELTTPAAGIVTSINEASESEPTVVSDDPEEEGWLVKIEIQDPTDIEEFIEEIKAI